MSPILVRPVREQLEHDRIIRLLQSKLRRKYEAGMNPGAEQNGCGRVGARGGLSGRRAACRRSAGRKLRRSSRSKPASRSIISKRWRNGRTSRDCARRSTCTCPSGMVDVARRLCEDNQIQVSEIWSYHTVGDEVRFTLVHRSREVPPPAAASSPRCPYRPAPPKARRARGQRHAAKPTGRGRRKKPCRAQNAPGEAGRRPSAIAWRSSGSRATSAATRLLPRAAERRRRGKRVRRCFTGIRTPPSVSVGRGPFDEFAQRTLERENPEVTFDWEAHGQYADSATGP